MAGGWPIFLDVCNGNDNGTVTTTSLATVVTSSSSANTKGSYAQLTAATAYDACYAMVTVGPPNSSGSSSAPTLVDIAVGASGSEFVIIPNFISDYVGFDLSGSSFGIPINIPAGTRIAARAQSSGGSQARTVQVTLFDGAFSEPEGFSIVDNYGSSTSTSLGTAVTGSATANSKGSYVQLTASTTYDLAGIVVGFDMQSNSASYNYLVDISIGASGSEVVIIPNMMVANLGNTYATPDFSPFIPISIPAGTRIAARCQCTTASGKLGVSIYGVRR